MVQNRRDDAGFFGVRHCQVFLLFLCLTIAYGMRVNLSVAIVAMLDRQSANPDFEEFDWDESSKSLVLSSFFWGYIITQIPAGQLAERCGAKYLLLVAMSICSLLTTLTPLCASYGGWMALCALRVLEGLCQGVLFPSTHSLLSKWAPASERATLGTYCYSGSQFGTVVMLSISGILASSAMGWPSIFYFSGVAGGVWAIFWFIFGSNSPSEYRNISAEERAFIESAVETASTTDETKKRPPTPWLAMFTSLPFISLIIVHSAHNWGFWTLLTKIPAYMASVLGLDIKSNALLSALPYFAMMMMSYFFSYLSSVLVKTNWVPLQYSRKLFNSIGHWIPMIALVALGYVTSEQKNLAIGLLTLAVGINAATYLGFQCNHIDLAPNYAGTLMGITNCCANIMSIIAPLVVGVIVKEESNSDQWRIVFFISAGVYFVGNLLFVIFSKTNVQHWNEPAKRNDERNGSTAAAVA
ncbi:putative inorganic phosphate cotransporter isoform X3 [Bradysia coprophila]|uniref:putative inorganic phosphate cotransporter isoform X3 n=1 Tax=Bradysia coprophila TaxID=38358 RepID=UPI00187D822E|nr:putative inorganic phosphate cotransporter isoform X3 [Bradysia coprophila]